MKSIDLIILIIMLLSLVTAADYPRLTPYVNDFAEVLSASDEVYLNSMCKAIEESATVEIAVVTVKTTGGQDRIEYANRIGEDNGVGKEKTDNGVVVLWSMENERGGAIAIGRGIESVLTDSIVTNIGRNSRQYFDAGQYKEGFGFILTQVESKFLHTEDTNTSGAESFSCGLWCNLAIFLVVLFLILLFLVFIFGDNDDSFGGSSFILSSGGFGGGSFGGGSFGGGGGRF